MLTMNHWNYTREELERLAQLHPDDPKIVAALEIAHEADIEHAFRPNARKVARIVPLDL